MKSSSSNTEEANEASQLEFLTVRQLADFLQVTEMTVYRLARRGEVTYHTIGRALRFRRTDVEEYLSRCRVRGHD